MVTPDPVALLTAPVRFSPKSASLSLGAVERLKEVALVLLDHPELGAVEVQGHATGSQTESNTLSQTRAEAVMIWLVEHGVSPSRLSARGYGASRSGQIDDLGARERVEIHLVEPNPPAAE
jgi:outer membrane protein OmpA-like peptidoglycan-associated protein